MYTGRAPPGWPGDLAPPEAMSAADAKDASELAGVLEEYVLRCLFSKNWQLREAALQYIERQLSGDVSFQAHCAVATCSESSTMDMQTEECAPKIRGLSRTSLPDQAGPAAHEWCIGGSSKVIWAEGIR